VAPMSEMHAYELAGTLLRIADAEGSDTPRIVAREMTNDEYGLGQIRFKPGDVIVDVGAHVGMVAIWLALRNPEVTVIAVEPEPLNLSHLRANIAANGVRNIVVVPLALTADRRRLPIARPPYNSGGAGCYYDQANGYATSEVGSTTLDAIFEEFVPDRCRLLKVDCEGAEHEILPASEALRRVDWFAGEFHINARLAAKGHSNEELVAHVAGFIHPDLISVVMLNMGE
jgi:FkbM family methyltransferase